MIRPATNAGGFVSATILPTQHGPRGVRFDFNRGCRVFLPPGDWRVRLSDLDTDSVLFDEPSGGDVIIQSARFYFARFRIEVWDGNAGLFRHDYDAAGRDVLVQIAEGAGLGDTIAWFSYVERFQQRHRCRLTCAVPAQVIPLFRGAYPDITFVTHDEVAPERFYATYLPGLFSGEGFGPHDYRIVGFHRVAGYILGVDPDEIPPRVVCAEGGPPPGGPYVCIATQTTAQCKFWNNPTGWHEVVQFLRDSGYRVVCIDRRSFDTGWGVPWPPGIQDETGDRPLVERVRWLRHAEFFVGLSSGLSWLAWAAGTPVVLIGGATPPTQEFTTPYRVINYHTCNSCWADARTPFDPEDVQWCPRHAGTPRQFECTRLITAGQVRQTIERIQGFGRLTAAAA